MVSTATERRKTLTSIADEHQSKLTLHQQELSQQHGRIEQLLDEVSAYEADVKDVEKALLEQQKRLQNAHDERGIVANELHNKQQEVLREIQHQRASFRRVIELRHEFESEREHVVQLENTLHTMLANLHDLDRNIDALAHSLQLCMDAVVLEDHVDAADDNNTVHDL